MLLNSKHLASLSSLYTCTWTSRYERPTFRGYIGCFSDFFIFWCIIYLNSFAINAWLLKLHQQWKKTFQTGVNFINVLRMNFSYKHHFPTYFLALSKNSYEKRRRKKLMKLTPDAQNPKFFLCTLSYMPDRHGNAWYAINTLRNF